MKKPIIYSFAAVSYITFIVSLLNFIFQLKLKESILMPMAMLGLFVLSASVMGFLFLSEPLMLYIDGQKKEAVMFFGKTVGFFACFIIILALIIFIY